MYSEVEDVMSARLRIPLLLWIVCLGLLFSANPVEATKPLAKITSFKGEVIILSDAQLTKVSKTGLILNEGDSIQTKDGQAEVTFVDGAIMRLSPYTSTMLQEREEESGWIFKTKTVARRLTIFVGKLWFSSGASHTKNFLQTPSAVCGLRGSVSEIGYDNIKSFLNIISGGADTIGEFVRGIFETPGLDAAIKSNVYQALVAASQAYTQAQQTGATLDMAQAELSGLQAIKTAADALKNNPDPIVASQATQALNAVTTRIEEKQKQIDQIPTTVAPTTTTGEPTTTSAEPTTTAAPTTTRVLETTTLREMTTTAPLPSIPLPSATIPTTTTSTLPSTTTTSSTEGTTTTSETSTTTSSSTSTTPSTGQPVSPI